MSEQIIKFIAPKKYANLKVDLPKPIKLNIPEWYKKLSHNLENQTIKGCIPFLDTLTTGYVLSLPQDMIIEHNFVNPKSNKKDSFFRNSLEDIGNFASALNINVNIHSETHPIHQLGGVDGGCPFVKKNNDLPFYKILNPWIIKTPPGYSCLFTAPLNNADDRFTALSEIVDTDIYDSYINFPIVLNGDKYPELKTILKVGTPYVQVIPFKRDNWKMQIAYTDRDERWARLEFLRKFIHKYKTIAWRKKSWK